MKGRKVFVRGLLWMVILFFVRTLTLPAHVHAQDAVNPITYDDVNAIAERLYCPVCPNERLSDCQTQACAQWKNEIADQLAAGQTETQIIDSFVRRYGDRVVHIPQDPFLRGLSLVTPFALAIGVLAIGAMTFTRWTRRRAVGNLSNTTDTNAVDEAGLVPPDGARDRIVGTRQASSVDSLSSVNSSKTASNSPDDPYRARLEQDVSDR